MYAFRFLFLVNLDVATANANVETVATRSYNVIATRFHVIKVGDEFSHQLLHRQAKLRRSRQIYGNIR